MELKDCKPGSQVIITDEHARSRLAIPCSRSLSFYMDPWYTFKLYKKQGIILSDRTETFEEPRKSVNPVTGKLYNIMVTKHKVAIMLTSGDKVYLKPDQIKVLRSK